MRHNLIERLPDNLGALAKLKKLLLAANALVALPETLGQCSKIAALDMRNNRLAALPTSFGGLSSLVEANFECNALVSPLPASLGGLRRLKVLDVRDNAGLRALPVELVRDTPLCNLLVGPALVGPDGQLLEMEGRDAYLERRKARIEKEMHAKERGGEVHFSAQ